MRRSGIAVNEDLIKHNNPFVNGNPFGIYILPLRRSCTIFHYVPKYTAKNSIRYLILFFLITFVSRKSDLHPLLTHHKLVLVKGINYIFLYRLY